MFKKKVILFKKAETPPPPDPDIEVERRKLEDSRQRLAAIKIREMLRRRSTT